MEKNLGTIASRTRSKINNGAAPEDTTVSPPRKRLRMKTEPSMPGVVDKVQPDNCSSIVKSARSDDEILKPMTTKNQDSSPITPATSATSDSTQVVPKLQSPASTLSSGTDLPILLKTSSPASSPPSGPSAQSSTSPMSAQSTISPISSQFTISPVPPYFSMSPEASENSGQSSSPPPAPPYALDRGWEVCDTSASNSNTPSDGGQVSPERPNVRTQPRCEQREPIATLQEGSQMYQIKRSFKKPYYYKPFRAYWKKNNRGGCQCRCTTPCPNCGAVTYYVPCPNPN